MSASAHTAASEPEVDQALLRRAICASAIGNAVEWFDYGIYAYGTVYIGRALFPANSTNATIFTLLGFAISFIMRPFGGIVWGPLGDRVGRKKVLAATITLMAGATFLLGLLPTYSMIGIGAPILLYLLRMTQGFSTGGEYGGAATFMAEYSPDRRRGFFGSFLEFGSLAGFNFGALLMLLMIQITTDSQMNAWGWRVPFLIAGPLGMVGIYLRSRMEDTPIFREIKDKGEEESHSTGAFRDLFENHRAALMKLMGLVLALNVVYYIALTYTPTYLTEIGKFSDSQALMVPIFGQFLMMLCLPIAGAVSDRWGRKPSWALSLVGLIIGVVPCYKLMDTGFTGAVVGFAIIGLLFVPQLATISATFPAMFPTQVRYVGVALGYNVSTSLFGGTAAVINDAMVKKTGDRLFPAYYMIGACVIGLIALLFTIETKGHSLRGTHTPGTEAAIVEAESTAPLAG